MNEPKQTIEADALQHLDHILNTIREATLVESYERSQNVDKETLNGAFVSCVIAITEKMGMIKPQHPDHQTWWDNEGSGMGPTKGEDLEEFMFRLTQIAWANGTYVERMKHENHAGNDQQDSKHGDQNLRSD